MLLNNLYVLGYLLIMFLQQIVYGDLINFDVYTTKIKIYLQRSEYLTTSNNIKHNCKRMSSPVLQVFFCLLASLFKYIQPLLSRHFNSIFYFFFWEVSNSKTTINALFYFSKLLQNHTQLSRDTKGTVLLFFFLLNLLCHWDFFTVRCLPFHRFSLCYCLAMVMNISSIFINAFIRNYQYI